MPTLILDSNLGLALLGALPDGIHSAVSIALAILGLGFLIFIHELGHFLACRLTKTRVEAFSIGFGPRLCGWETSEGRRTFTVGARRTDPATGAMDVRLAAIPLGGYVKMAGEIGGDGTPTSGSSGSPRAPKPDEFPGKPFASRVFIISAGVIMNAITAFVFFWIAYAAGLLDVPPILGDVTPGGPGWKAGLRAGDRIVALDGEKIRTFSDLQNEIVFRGAGGEAAVEVVRDGATRTLRLKPEFDPEIGFQRAQVSPVAAWTIKRPGAEPVKIGATETVTIDDRPARGGYAAYNLMHDALDLGTASVRIGLPERPGAPSFDLDFALLRRAPKTGVEWKLGVAPGTLTVSAVRAGGPAAAAGLVVGDEVVSADGVAIDRRARLSFLPALRTLRVRRGGAEKDLVVGANDAAAAAEVVADVAFVANPPTGPVQLTPTGGELVDGKSPAGEAGMRAGDLLVSVAGKPVGAWKELLEVGKTLTEAPVALEVRTGSEPPRTLTVHPKPRRDPKAEEEIFELETPKVPVPVSGVIDAAGLALARTGSEVRNIFRLIGRFFGSEISFQKNVAGPLTIANMASRSANEGWTRFLQLLAFISINLCVLNILPIPVLDGGQLLFLLIEKARGGRPLSEATIAKLQLTGFALLMLLMFFALKNDVTNLFVK